MKSVERVRLTSAVVNAEAGQVIWTVELPSGDAVVLLWELSQFGAAWGIRSKVSAGEIEEFGGKMVGREFNLVRSTDESNSRSKESSRAPIQMPDKLAKPDPEFWAYHREHVFAK